MSMETRHRLPHDPLPVGDTLRRSCRTEAGPAAPRDALSPWRRRALRGLVGWLARRFQAAAEVCDNDAAARYRTYVDLLRRIEGDMAMPGGTGAPAGRQRGHLRVIGDE